MRRTRRYGCYILSAANWVDALEFRRLRDSDGRAADPRIADSRECRFRDGCGLRARGADLQRSDECQLSDLAWAYPGPLGLLPSDVRMNRLGGNPTDP